MMAPKIALKIVFLFVLGASTSSVDAADISRITIAVDNKAQYIEPIDIKLTDQTINYPYEGELQLKAGEFIAPHYLNKPTSYAIKEGTCSIWSIIKRQCVNDWFYHGRLTANDCKKFTFTNSYDADCLFVVAESDCTLELLLVEDIKWQATNSNTINLSSAALKTLPSNILNTTNVLINYRNNSKQFGVSVATINFDTCYSGFDYWC